MFIVFLSDIFVHQVNLVVSDYFKSESEVLIYTDKATEVITWLCSKTLVLCLIHELQLQTSGTMKAVFHAVLTCWTAHYMTFNHLLELHPTIMAVIYQDEVRAPADKLIITGNAKTKEKSRKMIEILKDNLFWFAIARYVVHLYFSSCLYCYWRITWYLWPLAIAANVVRSSFCCINTVLLTFGFLIMQYQKMQDAEDILGRDAIMNSIERCWAKADHEIFIAAVIMNPFYKSTIFHPLPFLNNSGIHNMMSQLWK